MTYCNELNDPRREPGEDRKANEDKPALARCSAASGASCPAPRRTTVGSSDEEAEGCVLFPSASGSFLFHGLSFSFYLDYKHTGIRQQRLPIPFQNFECIQTFVEENKNGFVQMNQPNASRWRVHYLLAPLKSLGTSVRFCGRSFLPFLRGDENKCSLRYFFRRYGIERTRDAHTSVAGTWENTSRDFLRQRERPMKKQTPRDVLMFYSFTNNFAEKTRVYFLDARKYILEWWNMNDGGTRAAGRGRDKKCPLKKFKFTFFKRKSNTSGKTGCILS